MLFQSKQDLQVSKHLQPLLMKTTAGLHVITRLTTAL